MTKSDTTVRGPFRQRDWAVHPPALTPDYKSTILRAPRLPLLALDPELNQAERPLFGHTRPGALDNDLTRNFSHGGDPIGERIIVHGRLRDENGRPVPDVLIEVWQANAAGRYRHPNDTYCAPLDPNFGGCGRTLSGADGSYHIQTIKPGPYPWPNGPNDWRPAHIHFSLFGAAFAQRLVTQMYFEGDPLIPLCPIVRTIPEADAIARLVAPLDRASAVPFDCLAYRFDIVLRGRQATPFASPDPGR